MQENELVTSIVSLGKMADNVSLSPIQTPKAVEHALKINIANKTKKKEK